MTATTYSEWIQKWIQIGSPMAMVILTAALVWVTYKYVRFVKEQLNFQKEQTDLLRQQTQNLLGQDKKRFVDEYFIDPLLSAFDDWRRKLPKKSPEGIYGFLTLNYDDKNKRIELMLSKLNYSEKAKEQYLKQYPELEPELKSMQEHLNALYNIIEKFNNDILNETVMRNKVMGVLELNLSNNKPDPAYMFIYLITLIWMNDPGNIGQIFSEPTIKKIRDEFIEVRDKLLDKIDIIENEIKKKPYIP